MTTQTPSSIDRSSASPRTCAPTSPELRRLEQTAGATPSELEERRELVARLQRHLAGLVRTALAPPEPPPTSSTEGPAPQRHAPHSRSRSYRRTDPTRNPSTA